MTKATLKVYKPAKHNKQKNKNTHIIIHLFVVEDI